MTTVSTRNSDAEESAALNTRLILTLANHIGGRAVLSEALEVVRRSSR